MLARSLSERFYVYTIYHIGADVNTFFVDKIRKNPRANSS